MIQNTLSCRPTPTNAFWGSVFSCIIDSGPVFQETGRFKDGKEHRHYERLEENRHVDGELAGGCASWSGRAMLRRLGLEVFWR